MRTKKVLAMLPTPFKRALYIGLILLFPAIAHAQLGAISGYALAPASLNQPRGAVAMVPITYGQIRVCTTPVTVTVTPCTTPATIYDLMGNSLNVIGGNFGQTKTDNTGFYNFQCSVGEYFVQVAASASNVSQKNFFVSCGSVGGAGTGPSLQTNGATNTSQTVLNLTNGPNVTFVANGSGGVTGSVPLAVTPPTCFQYDVSGLFTNAPGICTPDGNQLSIKGNSPWSDITAFGARAFNGPSAATVSFTSGTATVTSSTTQFINGDGVTLQGAGATVTMSTPSAPTVVPQYANAPTRDHIMSNSPTGASTYIYCVVAEDRGQGLTPCSATTTINTGTATLGKQTVNISSESLSNDTLTVNTASGTFVAGMLVDVISGVARFTGLMRTSTGGAGTFTVAQYVYDSRLGPVNTADTPNSTSAAGTVVFYQANTISWPMVTGARRFWICAQRPGDSSLHVIAQSDMSYSSTGWQAVQFEDYGATYLAGQAFPYYITDAICTGSGQADSLTTTVVSGGGTTSPVLAAAPSQTDNTNTKKMVYDSAPNILAAAQQAANGQGCVYIPPQTSVLNNFLVQSLLSLPGGICIIQSGGLLLADTLEITNTHWVGWNQAGVPAFGFSRGAAVITTSGNPAVHMVGTGEDISNVTFVSSVNGSTVFTVDNASTILTTVNCAMGNADYWGMCIQYRNTTATIDSHKILGGSSFTSGMPQTGDLSWTPLIDIPFGQNGAGAGANSGEKLEIDNFSGNRRSISYVSGATGLNLSHYYIQGPIFPTITFMSQGGGNSPIYLNDVLEDTSGEPILGSLGGGVNLQLHANINASATNPVISGTRPALLLSDGYFYSGLANPPGRWAQNCSVASAISGVYEGGGTPQNVGQQLCYFGNLVMMQGGYPVYWPLSTPATPTLAGPSAGGSMPSGTFEYVVSATGFDGGETIPSVVPSAPITTGAGCPGAGNCTVTVNLPTVVGAQSLNIWRCNTAAVGGCTSSGLINGNFFEVGLHQTGASFNDTINAPTNNKFAQVTGTGISQMDALEVIAPQFVGPETTAPTCKAGFDQLFGLIANHRLNFCDNGGSSLVVAANPMTTLGDLTYGGATSGGVATETRLAGPTATNGVPQTLTETPAGGLAVAPTWAPVGVVPNAQTGASYTILATDRAGYLSFSNAGAIAVTLPQAGTTGFASNFVVVACDIGAGTATITPTTSTISFSTGAAYTSASATMTLTTGQCAWIYSDNTNYFAIRR